MIRPVAKNLQWKGLFFCPNSDEDQKKKKGLHPKLKRFSGQKLDVKTKKNNKKKRYLPHLSLVCAPNGLDGQKLILMLYANWVAIFSTSAENRLKSAKNAVFSFFCMSTITPPPPPSGNATANDITKQI